MQITEAGRHTLTYGQASVSKLKTLGFISKAWSRHCNHPNDLYTQQGSSGKIGVQHSTHTWMHSYQPRAACRSLFDVASA
jgi:hypothetical protein